MCILSVVFISVPVSAFAQLFDITHRFKNITTQIALYGIFIAPILEEILFRLLLKPTKSYVYIYLFVIISWIAILIYFNKYSLAGGAMFVLILTLILIFLVSKKIIDLNNKFRYLFYLSVSIFALLHLINLEGLSFFIYFIAPIFVIPQFIMGLIFGYTRMIYGFRYSVFLHICVNMVGLSIYLIKGLSV